MLDMFLHFWVAIIILVNDVGLAIINPKAQTLASLLKFFIRDSNLVKSLGRT